MPKPYPTEVGPISIHFLPDGTLKAHLAKFGKGDGEGPLSAEDIRAHLGGAETPICRTPALNPWHGIPRKKHSE